MRTAPVFVGGILALAGFLAGCQTASRSSFEIRDEQGGDVSLSRAEADLAEALAQFGVGILREGMADPGALTNYLHAVQLRPDRIDLYVRVVAVRLRQGENAEAVAVMKEACRRNPHSAEACIYLAQIHQALKQGEAAREACLQALRADPGNYKGYLQLALLFREEGDEPRALATLEDALAKVSDKRPILRLLGDWYVQRSGDVMSGKLTPDLQKAMEYYQRASREPRDELTLPYIQQLGDLYLLTRQIEGAIACFTAVAAQTPGNIQVQKKLALCYLTTGNKEKAVASLKVIADQEPKNTEVQYTLGELYENLSDPINAVARFTSACEGAPATAKPYLKLASFYINTDPQKAGQVLESGLKQLPEDQKILEMLAQLYLTNRQNEEAKETLSRLQALVARHQDRGLAARLAFHYGVAAQQYTLVENAESLYRQAMELDPSLVDAYVRLAFLFLSQTRQEEAVQIMKKADQTLPDNFAINYFMGLLYSRLGRYGEARDALEKARDAASADPEEEPKLDSAFYFSYGAACERLGEWRQAEALLQYALVLNAENIEAFNYLAYMWAERGTRLVQALDTINHALDEDPENGAFIDTRGWIYFKQGRYPEALDEIENALAFMPEDPAIMEHKGDILAALHREKEALSWWEKSYRKNPDAPGLKEKLKAHGISLDLPRQTPVRPAAP